jgi:hypothetical protein
MPESRRILRSSVISVTTSPLPRATEGFGCLLAVFLEVLRVLELFDWADVCLEAVFFRWRTAADAFCTPSSMQLMSSAHMKGRSIGQDLWRHVVIQRRS